MARGIEREEGRDGGREGEMERGVDGWTDVGRKGEMGIGGRGRKEGGR